MDLPTLNTGEAGLEETPAAAAAAAAAAVAAAPAAAASAEEAWSSLGRRTRMYIAIQHGKLDSSDARIVCEAPWQAVRCSIEKANDEFDGDAAEDAIVSLAQGRGSGGSGN